MQNSTIYLLKNFNNYFNRRIIKFDTITEYTNSFTYINTPLSNFNPADGVDTEHIFNWSQDWTPDYIIITEQVGTGLDTVTVIKSRWFVLEWERTRGGQYRAVLHRDVISDNYEEFISSTCFVEKGTVKIDDPAIYNKEDMTFNAIKKDEYLLKDETQCGWVVGYVAKSKEDSGISSPVTFETNYDIENLEATTSQIEEVYDTFEDFYEAHPEINRSLAVITSSAYSCTLDVGYQKLFGTFGQGLVCSMDKNKNVFFSETTYQDSQFLHGNINNYIWKSWIFDARNKLAENLLKNWKSIIPLLNQQVANRENVLFVEEDFNDLAAMKAYANKTPIVKVGNKVYKVTLSKTNGTVEDYPTYEGEMFNIMNANINREPSGIIGNDVISGNAGPETYKFKVSWIKYAAVLEEIHPNFRVRLGENFIPSVLSDQPYYMFAIPFSNDLTIFSGDNVYIKKTNKQVAIAAAQAIATTSGAGAVYDIQLLPYCPIRNAILTTSAPKGGYKIMDGGTYDIYVVRLPLETKIERTLKTNHNYYLSKDTVLSSAASIISDSDIILRYDSVFDEETVDYNVKKITIDPEGNISAFTNISDITPAFTTTYNEFITGNNIFNIYLSDIADVSTEQEEDQQNLVLSFKDLVYYGRGETFISKVDVGTILHSDIIPVVEGVEQNEVISTVLWANTSKFSFNIPLATNLLMSIDDNDEIVYVKNEVTKSILDETNIGSNNIDKKINSQVNNLRLASPNYSNFFDINVQYNNGIDYFNVDCFYKPYAPYIHVNPNFKGIYGADYDDIRGLICGGDYSIAVVTDAWATYQLQNKNYMAAFDRNVQVIELNNSLQKQHDIWSAVAGTFGAGAAGSLAGAKLGGIGGAIGGAIVGGSLSAIGGLADIQNNEIIRNVNLQNMRDQFGYQLGNIQALPEGLAKTSAYTNNNKIYPFLEFYTCTPEERLALENKIEYNGMTIMRVGTPSEFITNQGGYIKGRIIRINISEDNHYVAVMNDEFMKGVYI